LVARKAESFKKYAECLATTNRFVNGEACYIRFAEDMQRLTKQQYRVVRIIPVREKAL